MLIIFNPCAGGGSDGIPELMRRAWPDATFATTERAGHASELAASSAHTGVRELVVVGGDGTIREVIDGLMQVDGANIRRKIGILPRGTGNDFARWLDLPLDPEKCVVALREGSCVDVDVMQIRDSSGTERYAVNAINAGFAATVSEHLDDATKSRLSHLAYVQAAAQAWDTLVPEPVRVRITAGRDSNRDCATGFEGDAFGIVVANGPTVGGGRVISSSAVPTDGSVQVVVARAETPADAFAHATRLLWSELDAGFVYRASASELVLEGPASWSVNLDGDPLCALPVRLRVVPKALRFLRGPS